MNRLHRLLLTLLLSACCTPWLQAATYTASPTAYNWIDPTSHTNVVWTAAPGAPANQCSSTAIASDDDITPEINLGFNFNIGGSNYNRVRVMTNGRLQFNNRFCGRGSQAATPQLYNFPIPDTRLVRTVPPAPGLRSAP